MQPNTLTPPGYLDKVDVGDTLLVWSSRTGWGKTHYQYGEFKVTKVTKTRIYGQRRFVDDDGQVRLGEVTHEFRRGKGRVEWAPYRGEGHQVTASTLPLMLFLDTTAVRAWIEPQVAEADGRNLLDDLVFKVEGFSRDDWRELSTDQLQNIVDLVELSKGD